MDRESFTRLLEPCLDSAYGYAFKLAGNQDDAMDLVQEASVQAFKSIGTFQEGTNFKAWFMKILTNKFYKSKSREAKRSADVPLDDAEDHFLFRESMRTGVQDAAEKVIDRLDHEEVSAAIEGLPEEYRIVSLLYFLNDFSYEEIAAAAEIPLGTVRSRLHRGRHILQKRLWQVAAARGLVSTAKEFGGEM